MVSWIFYYKYIYFTSQTSRWETQQVELFKGYTEALLQLNKLKWGRVVESVLSKARQKNHFGPGLLDWDWVGMFYLGCDVEASLFFQVESDQVPYLRFIWAQFQPCFVQQRLGVTKCWWLT